MPETAAPILADLRERAARCNRGVVERANAYLDPVKVDYEKDIVPLTPGGNPTERHIVLGYTRVAEEAPILDSGAAEFWAEKLIMPRDQVAALKPRGFDVAILLTNSMRS